MKTTPYIYVLLLLTQMAFAQVANIPPPLIVEEPKRSYEEVCLVGFREFKPEFPGGEKVLMQQP